MPAMHPSRMVGILSMCCNIPWFRNRCLPCSRMVHSWRANRALLVEEVFLAHGFNLFTHQAQSSEICRIAMCLRAFDVKQQKLLLRNASHLLTLWCGVFYVLARFVKIPNLPCEPPEQSFLRGGTCCFSRAYSGSDI